ncbi:MAG: ABC transporter ATP-binding protein [Promethearchaeota archaeon]|nr:MAG: ABC transporter ATP-binding protein [Candidatus Lokiarchaeota archaeon]
MSETVIKIENLSKNFGNLLAVNKLNLEVKSGETIGLVGPNGAGKTTTIKMMANIIRPTEGRILIRNDKGKLKEFRGSEKLLSKMGFLIDIPEFYNMTAYQLLNYFANLMNYPAKKIDRRINELLDQFKLLEWKHKRVSNFSKGMKQKLGIIQSIIHNPDIIILDEPQTGLDPTARIDVREYIRRLQKQQKSIFVASHMLHEISEVCDKIALINHGKIIGFDTIDNLEKLLGIKEMDWSILQSLSPEKIEEVVIKLIEKLDPFLNYNLDPNISERPIGYNPESKTFRIFFTGGDETKGEILKILIKEFDTYFTVISYDQPKNELERIYSRMIKEDNLKKQK